MAKSIVSLAVGMALAEGRIASLDDTVAKYVPKLAGAPYGETSIRNVLRMSSGVPFREVYDGDDDLTRFVRARNTHGSIAALHMFDRREAEQGTRFHYASSETVLACGAAARGHRHHAQRVSDAAVVAADGRRSRRDLDQGLGRHRIRVREFQCDVARLRRLGMLLANDGAVGGKAGRAEGLSAGSDRLAPAPRRRSRRGAPRRSLDTATSSGLFRARSEGLPCSGFTARRSSSIPN